MDFTLNNGEIKTRAEAVKIVTSRLPSWLYTMESRKAAALAVTDPTSGHAGYTVVALVREAMRYGGLEYKGSIKVRGLAGE